MRPKPFFQINSESGAEQRPSTLGHLNDSYTCSRENSESSCSLSVETRNCGGHTVLSADHNATSLAGCCLILVDLGISDPN